MYDRWFPRLWSCLSEVCSAPFFCYQIILTLCSLTYRWVPTCVFFQVIVYLCDVMFPHPQHPPLQGTASPYKGTGPLQDGTQKGPGQETMVLKCILVWAVPSMCLPADNFLYDLYQFFTRFWTLECPLGVTVWSTQILSVSMMGFWRDLEYLAQPELKTGCHNWKYLVILSNILLFFNILHFYLYPPDNMVVRTICTEFFRASTQEKCFKNK